MSCCYRKSMKGNSKCFWQDCKSYRKKTLLLPFFLICSPASKRHYWVLKLYGRPVVFEPNFCKISVHLLMIEYLTQRWSFNGLFSLFSFFSFCLFTSWYLQNSFWIIRKWCGRNLAQVFFPVRSFLQGFEVNDRFMNKWVNQWMNASFYCRR